MNLYIMRHGTTSWNEKGITQGRSKNRLSRRGIALTRQKAIELKSTQIDVIISSPLMRTIQTANIINEYHKVKIVKDEKLIEIDQGIFTGGSKYNLTQDESSLKLNRSKSANMESFQECFNRAKSFLDSVKDKYCYNNILVITHDSVATFLEDIILNKKVDFTNAVFLHNFDNAEIKRFII